MDELRGPNIQIVLYVKEGLGFGFLKTPFIVSGSLNGYMLETDPTVPCHAPVFDAELVWEADKRRFRSLRVQNVPVKVEVYATGTQGRKDKVGYLLLSLLGAQPCPANKVIDMKHTWHRLLGVKSAGKCCHPQLLMSLSVEDRVTMLTPRNELRMFHSNEIAYPSSYSAGDPPAGRSVLMTIEEYMMESKKTVTSLDLQPRLICDEGVIQIGDGSHLFVLSFVIGSVENIDLLLPEKLNNESADCYVAYSVFTHDVMTDRVCATSASCGGGAQAQFNQRTSLRLRATLRGLTRYFAECPHLVVRICVADKDVGVCSMDLRKLVPTEDLQRFVDDFCNSDGSLTIHERCFILRCGDSGAGAGAREAARRPYVDVEMSLRHVESDKRDCVRPAQLTARSAAQLTARSAGGGERVVDGARDAEGGGALGFRSGSCAHLDADVGGVAYTGTASADTNRYKTASGDSVLQINEIAELLRKMCDAFSLTQQRLQAGGGTGSGVQGGEPGGGGRGAGGGGGEPPGGAAAAAGAGTEANREPVKLETSKSDTCIWHHDKDLVKQTIPALERDAIMQRFVDELEDWKEKQQELFKCQLKRKEDYHLELLSKEWSKKRFELESKLSKGIEQCRTLAADLSRATDDFRLRGYRNTEREKKLLEAKKALETHYTAKYQELREASRKMEDDMSHQLKLKDMRVEELEMKVAHLEKQVDTLKNNMKNSEKDAESRYSGLTKDQTASLIQELRCLEEKLDGAVQSKAFFKEQWGRAVRELHLLKLASRRRALDQLRRDRSQLPGNHGLDTIADQDEPGAGGVTEADMKRLRDDFYVDILANTPALDSVSMISTSGPDITGMDMFDGLKTASRHPANEKLNELIAARDRLIQDDNPDEEMIKQLNHDIRSMLLNCST